MKRQIALLCLAALAASLNTRAAITVLDFYRMGEDDPNPHQGFAPGSTRDSVSNKHLSTSAPGYTMDVAPAAAAHVGSLFALDFFTGGLRATGVLVSTVIDNFGVEAWVKPTSTTSNHFIAYNGNTGTSGWGLVQNSATFQGILGNAAYVGSAPVVSGSWTHVALVRSGGTATLYVNGVASGSSTAPPHVPTDGFAVGAPPQAPLQENFAGIIDEVRVFTFAPGQFSTNDLLLNAPFAAPAIVSQSVSGITHEAATITATVNPRGLMTPVQFQYSTTTSYGTVIVSNAPALTTNTSVSVALNLTANTLYHFRLTVTNAAGTNVSGDFTFTTLPGTNITVNTTSDSGPGSLRQAIINSATNAIISITATGTITLGSSLPLITNSITFNGPGATNLTISGADAHRVFFVDASNRVVSFNNLTIANGRAKGGNGGDSEFGGGGGLGAGAGVFVNAGQVVVSNVVFSGNSAVGGNGGNFSLAYNGGAGGGGGLGGNGGTGRSLAGGGGGGFMGHGGSSILGDSGGGGGGIFGNGGNGNINTNFTGGGGGGGALTGGQTATNASGGLGADGLGGNGGNFGGNNPSQGQSGLMFGGGGGAGYTTGAGNGGAGGKFAGAGGSNRSGHGGDAGDFGGGGGVCPTLNPFAGVPGRPGNGGFGGGGGGGNGSDSHSGSGGFGGGAGGSFASNGRGNPGPFGGASAYDYGGGAGGGGAALGAAIFVRTETGGSLLFADSSTDVGTLTPGAAGIMASNLPPQQLASPGQTAGSAIFLLGGTNNIFANSGIRTISGSIGGWTGAPIALVKSGAAMLILAATNGYTGATYVNAGTLRVDGSIASSSNTIVAGGAKVTGTGALNGLALMSGSTLSPGISVGMLTAGNTVWSGAGHYNWQLYDATNLPGAGYDLLDVNGTLDVSAANGFNINLWTLSSLSPATSGAAINFDSSGAYLWTLVRTTGGIVGFNAANFNLVRAPTNTTAGFANSASGTFTLAVVGNDLLLFYSVGPIATTLAATDVSRTNATLNAAVNPQGAPTSVWFEYGFSTNYGSFTPTNIIPAGAVASISQLITGLSPKANYHFRVVAANNNGVRAGADMSFTTPAVPPQATTPTVTELSPRGARLNTFVTPGTSPTSVYFAYGGNSLVGGVLQPGFSPVLVSNTIGNLQPGTTFTFHVFAQSADGTVVGPNVSFTTLSAPQPTTLAASSIGLSNATLNARIDTGITNAVAWFEYGLTTNYGNVTATTSVPLNGAALVSQPISGLALGTQYHFRAVATNSFGTGIGADAAFTTAAANGIAVLAYYRLGEADPGAVVGGVSTATRDSAGTKDLTVAGGPVYSADVDVRASNRAGSSLSLDFTSDNSYAIRDSISLETDNFCLEAWVKPTINSGSRVIAYNGDTVHNGWGLVQSGDAFQGLLAGVSYVGYKQFTAGNWAHLALVLNNGTATLYVDGVASGASAATAILPSSSFALGARPELPSMGKFAGYVDEVRCFSFPAGQFNTNQLLLNASAAVVPPLLVGPTLSNGVVQISFTNVVGATFTMLAATNISLPLSNWTMLGPVTENPPGQYRFTDSAITNKPTRFYRVRSP